MSGRGTGLGMATVYGIVKQNNGFINVYSELDQGTTIKVYLPRHMEPISRTAERELLEAVAKGDETILVVEDEEPILRMTKIMLERLGYSVLAASCPAEAIQTAESHPEEVHMLMTDVVMPDMSGKDLAEKLIRLHPRHEMPVYVRLYGQRGCPSWDFGRRDSFHQQAFFKT